MTNNQLRKPFFVMVLATIFYLPCHAQTNVCKKYEESGTTDPIAATKCAEEKRKIADAKLNASYKKLIARLKNDTERENFSRSQIVDAQKAWIAFRDAECDLQQSLNSGTRAWKAVHGIDCKREMTEIRTQTLEQYFKDIQE